MHGASLVRVDYRGAPQLTNIDAPQTERRESRQAPDHIRGDADAALRAAPVVTDLQFSIERNNHNPMELGCDRRQLGRRPSDGVGQGAKHQQLA